ncbi:MAG: inositol monophosphatase [Candidatus Micrarchaeota archaeon]
MSKFLDITKKAALAGGKVAEKYFDTGLKIQRKRMGSWHDNFTKADIESENEIKHLLSDAFPEHQVLGEETGLDTKSGDSNYIWHIDPLDGTNNFVGGNATWGVSVGLAYRDVPIAGAIYFPTSNSIYLAEEGKGATKNGKKIRCKSVKRIEDSISVFSSYFKGPNTEKILEALGKIGPKCLGVRMYGSAVYNFAMLAEGQVSAIVKNRLMSWDICAGAVLVREAGGEVFTSKGKDWTIGESGVFATATKELKSEFMKLMNSK